MTRIKLYFAILLAVVTVITFNGGGKAAADTTVSPLNITVLSGNLIRLEWEDNIDGERGYRIERKTGSGQFALRATTGSNVTRYHDYNVREEEVYTYRIVLINSKGGLEVYSNEVSVSTLSVKRPSSIELVPISSTEVEITWQYPGLKGFATYVERNKRGTGGWEQVAFVPEGIESFRDSGLEPDTLYYYRIRATGGPDVYSEYYPSQNGRAVYMPLSGPTNLYGYVDNMNRIVLTWDDVDNETSYAIERKVGDGDYSMVGMTGKNTTQWRDHNATKGALYSYRVKALRGTRESFYSNEISITCHYVAPPASLTAESSDGDTIKLTWTDNENLEGEYEIYRRSAADTEWSLLAVLPGYMREYKDEGLPASAKYYYRIRVVVDYRDAQSSYSNWVSAETAGLEAPYNLRYQVWDENRIRLMWNYKSSVRISGFRIERKEEGGLWTDIGGVPSNTLFYYDSVGAYKECLYRVKAYDNNSKTVSYSDAVRVLPGLPQSPESLELVGISCREVKLLWSDDALNEEGYIVERRMSGTSFIQIASLSAGTTRYVDRNVLPGGVYSYRVKAFNKAGSNTSRIRTIRVDRAVVFDDIPAGHPSIKNVEILATRGITELRGKFRPDERISRAEFTAWVIRAFKFNEIPVGSFSDVKFGDAYYAEIMAAKRLGITEGDSKERFKPNEHITREDAAVIVFRAAQATGVSLDWYDASALEAYPDWDTVSEYSLIAFATLVEEGIFYASKDGMLQPKGNISRIQAADIIINLLQKIQVE